MTSFLEQKMNKLEDIVNLILLMPNDKAYLLVIVGLLLVIVKILDVVNSIVRKNKDIK